jgi:hypothetical protein
LGISGVAEVRGPGAQQISGEDALLQRSSVHTFSTEGVDEALTACAEASCSYRRAQ